MDKRENKSIRSLTFRPKLLKELQEVANVRTDGNLSMLAAIIFEEYLVKERKRDSR